MNRRSNSNRFELNSITYLCKIWVDIGEDTLQFSRGFNKWTPGCQLWGGIWEGLIPKEGPFFFTDWLIEECKRIKKKKKTLDNRTYARFIRTVAARYIRRSMGDLDDIIFQDENDKKQRTPHVLSTLSELFPERIPVNRLCAKYADVWPIENVWGQLKNGVNCQ